MNLCAQQEQKEDGHDNGKRGAHAQAVCEMARHEYEDEQEMASGQTHQSGE